MSLDDEPAVSRLRSVMPFHRKWIAYLLLNIPLVLLLMGRYIWESNIQISAMGMLATWMFGAWLITGIYGGAGDDVPEGEAEFGISFILLGLVSFGVAFSMAMGTAGTASDAIGIGLIVLLGALILLGVAPGIEGGSEYQAGGLVMAGALGSVLLTKFFSHVEYFPFLIYMAILYGMLVIAIARLVTMPDNRTFLVIVLTGYLVLIPLLWI